jgi:hypothetical protein
MTGSKTISNQRDLIAELEGCIQDLLDQGGAPSERIIAATAQARVYLSQPAPKPPTVMEIIELYDTLPEWDDGMVTFARAVLARWGN